MCVTSLSVSLWCVSIWSVQRTQHYPTLRPSPQKDRSLSEWSQAVSIHLQMNSAVFHQQHPPSLFFCVVFFALGPSILFLCWPPCLIFPISLSLWICDQSLKHCMSAHLSVTKCMDILQSLHWCCEMFTQTCSEAKCHHESTCIQNHSSVSVSLL